MEKPILKLEMSTIVAGAAAMDAERYASMLMSTATREARSDLMVDCAIAALRVLDVPDAEAVGEWPIQAIAMAFPDGAWLLGVGLEEAKAIAKRDTARMEAYRAAVRDYKAANRIGGQWH